MAVGLSFSDLPAEAIVAIISHLPISDAVRTSILSRSWRHHWRSIPDLAFTLDDDIDIAAVDNVLGLHSTPIQSFSLSVGEYSLDSNDLDRWLNILSADPLPLRSLTLDVWDTRISAYSLLWSFSNLNHLHLCCHYLPSYGLVGFPVLETLHLSGCILPDDDSCNSISNLISGCPLLKKLTLFAVACRHLRICALNLRSFVFRGVLKGFALASTPFLTTVVIHLRHPYGDDDKNECNLIKAFGDARSIKKLNLLNHSLRFFGKFRIPDSISDSFERLKVLTLSVDFSSTNETLVLLCLLRNAPNLHEIKIEGYGLTSCLLGHEFWQAQNHLELSKLQTMKLTNITCVEPLLEFIDYTLPKAPELKIMEINISHGFIIHRSMDKLPESRKLVLHWRASTRAKIIFIGHSVYECAIASSGLDDSLSVWSRSASWKEFNELEDHIESKLQGVEDHIKELHCQIILLLPAVPPEHRDAWVRTMVPPEHRDAWMRFGASYGVSDPSTSGSTNSNGVWCPSVTGMVGWGVMGVVLCSIVVMWVFGCLHTLL